MWYGVDPLGEKYKGLSPFTYVGNNPLKYIDPNGRDWLLVTGNKVNWYGGEFGDKSNLIKIYKATSRYRADGYGNYQVAKHQNLRDVGPTPEGIYSINLKPDPNRKAEISSNGQLKRNPEGEIENLVGMRRDGDSDNLYMSEDWGKNRAKLEPMKVTGATSQERDNESYYLHDSEKGYTHGCTEAETELFDHLKEYRSQGNDKIKVQVSYPNKEHKTYGGTDKKD